MKKTALKVKGYRIIVRVDPVEEESEGGIVIVQDEKLARAGVQTGIVLGIGPESFADSSSAWCEVGDRVMFSKYAVKFIEHPDTKELLGVINDQDVICTLEEYEDE